MALGLSLLWALAAGWLLFAGYALSRRVPPAEILRLSLDGMRTVSPILLTFVCIGLLTASWRACGTIAFLVTAALDAVSAALFLPCAFLLNCGLSFLLGSSFATAATMGVISFSVAQALQIPPAAAGGAMLAGIYFGDRCSPMSTSALLVATVTRTDIYANLALMWRSSWPAFLLSVLIYGLWAFLLPVRGAIPGIRDLFAGDYVLSWPTILPALLMLAMALARLPVRRAMLASTLLAVLLCLFLQDQSLSSVCRTLVLGWRASSPETARLMDGGGVFSMATAGGIVCLSSAYAGLFRKTELLRDLHGLMKRLARIRSFLPAFFAGCLTSAIACNQTLAIMLSHQLTQPLGAVPARQALDLEDSAVVISALIPWSIACAVPLRMAGAPFLSSVCAVYLWLLPLTRFFHAPARVRSQGPLRKT